MEISDVDGWWLVPGDLVELLPRAYGSRVGPITVVHEQVCRCHSEPMVDVDLPELGGSTTVHGFEVRLITT